jgi:hypothetical protein
MKYFIFILRCPQKELAKLSPSNYARLKEAIWSLEEEARPNKSQKLKGLAIFIILF